MTMRSTRRIPGLRSLVFAGLISFVAAQSSSASFAYPTSTPKLTINVIDTVDLEWSSNFDKAWLYLWCDEYNSAGNLTEAGWWQQAVDPSGNATYSPSLQSPPGKDWTKNFACHFDLVYNPTEQEVVHGPKINITSKSGVPATIYERQLTSIVPSTVVTPTASLASFSSFSSPTSTASYTGPPSATGSPSGSDASGGLSAGAKAGIALGAVFGASAITALAYLFYRNHRKFRDLEARIPQASAAEENAPPGMVERHDEQKYANELPVPPTEMEGHKAPETMHELP